MSTLPSEDEASIVAAGSDFLNQTQAWTSAAGEGPLLRGRRSSGSATPLHFLHGNGLCGAVYWPLLRQLTEHAIFCHDYEGHGASDRPTRFAGPRGLIRRIPQVIAEQQLPAGKLIGIGHSYGGALTLAVAAEHPELFRALILLDPILLPARERLLTAVAAALRINPMSRGARRRRWQWPNREAVWQRLHERGIYRGWCNEAFNNFIDYATRDSNGARELSCPPWLEAVIFDHPVSPWPAVRALRCPTLILYGRDSYPFMAGAMRKVQAVQPRVELVAMPGGHCFMLENPADSAALIREFIARHAG